MAAATPTLDYDRMEEVKKFDESKMGVKGLSDSGITSIPKIFIHAPDTLADLKPNSSHTSPSIPIIDLSNIYSNHHREQIISQVKEAATNWGFFQVINHGISQLVLDSTLKAIKSFHEQPHEVKSKYYTRKEGSGVMYASNNDLYRTEAACWHDSLQMWMAPVPLNTEEIPEICRKEVMEWDVCAKKVSEAVMELLSEGLGLEAGKFKELTFSDSRCMVGHCYPYCPQPDLTVGITAHTDPGVVTLLLQDEIGGLQVKHGDGWVEVKPVRVLDQTTQAIRAFHEQPPEMKAEYYKRENEMGGVILASNNDLYRTHDLLQVWTGIKAAEVEDIPEIRRREVVEWDLCATGFAEALMEVLSEGLGLESGKFKELAFSEGRVFVGHYHPFCPQPDLTMGIRSHPSFKELTLQELLDNF
ncbi:hypothetical protein GH714_030585 [Hevea brasiliensis]|uniref:Fe2OG dioxygenase domain-containing protein n=1 Tax=Hevea brasiliensis TaxID=3981 RepID=A0A6A6M538_HEVBR|nr:hypothetical protein GH714_030585 [Hevea brasiliensis]